jgi:hypothetical protein
MPASSALLTCILPYVRPEIVTRIGVKRFWPFTKRSEPACCKYLECVIEYAQYYLLGAFYQ